MQSAAPFFSREILHRWLLALGIFAALIFFFSPAWGVFRLAARVPEMRALIEVRRGANVLQQVAQPGVKISDPLHQVIQWRLLFPLLGHVLHLPPAPFFALAHLGSLLVLAWIVTLLRRQRFTWFDCGLATVTLGAASWFFTSCGWLGYFDSWLALALLFVAFAEARWAVWFACLWAPWVDERFVVAAPLALLCRALVRAENSTDEAFAFDWRRETVVPVLLLGGFAVVRLGFLSNHSSAGATASGYFSGGNFLTAPFARIALGIWEGLRVGWFFVGGAAVVLWRRPARAGIFVASVVALVALGIASAQDYSRSMTMLLPSAVFGVVVAASKRERWFPWALRVCAGTTLLLPAHHVMNDRVDSIFYLYHELDALKNPPSIAMPERYELKAVHEMERGNFNQAEADLALAIKLSENPSSPLKQRGILAASQGKWTDAQRYFSMLVEHDQQNPDAWFMRAQANLALRNVPAAQADIDRARTLAPTDWSTRPDVARFLTSLARATGSK